MGQALDNISTGIVVLAAAGGYFSSSVPDDYQNWLATGIFSLIAFIAAWNFWLYSDDRTPAQAR